MYLILTLFPGSVRGSICWLVQLLDFKSNSACHKLMSYDMNRFYTIIVDVQMFLRIQPLKPQLISSLPPNMQQDAATPQWRLSMSVVLSLNTSHISPSALSPIWALLPPPPFSCLVINTSLSNIRWRSKEGFVTLKCLFPSPCKSVVLLFEMIPSSLHRTIQWWWRLIIIFF